MTVLLDSNVLIALVVADHVHHRRAEDWFPSVETSFATCPITQGALLRLFLRHGGAAALAQSALASVTAPDGHQFWPDEVDHGDISLAGVIGHRQVTDAYLAGLARYRGGRLATFDTGLVALHPDVAEMVTPT